MSIRKLIAAALAFAVLAAIPAAASASMNSEIHAAGVVERGAHHQWRAFDFNAYCNQYSRTHYWCTISGSYDNGYQTCYRQGHADAALSRGWWTVRWSGLSRQCF